MIEVDNGNLGMVKEQTTIVDYDSPRLNSTFSERMDQTEGQSGTAATEMSYGKQQEEVDSLQQPAQHHHADTAETSTTATTPTATASVTDDAPKDTRSRQRKIRRHPGVAAVDPTYHHGDDTATAGTKKLSPAQQKGQPKGGTAITTSTSPDKVRSFLQSMTDHVFALWSFEVNLERQRRFTMAQKTMAQKTVAVQPSTADTNNNNEEGEETNEQPVGLSATVAVGAADPGIAGGTAAAAVDTERVDPSNPEYERGAASSQAVYTPPPDSSPRPFKRRRVEPLPLSTNNTDHIMEDAAEGVAAVDDHEEEEEDAKQAVEDGVKGDSKQPPQKQKDKRVNQSELKWNQRFQDLLDFRVQHGHCDVPDRGYGKLSRWVNSQRRLYKKYKRGETCSMTVEKETKMCNLGFRFAVKLDWDARYQQMLDFHATHGHVDVPPDYQEQDNLGGWVRGMRKEYRKVLRGKQTPSGRGALSYHFDDEKMQLLSNLGFEWDVSRDCKGEYE
jgi:hypothetical protein